MTKKNEVSTTAANMGFSAMLAEEHILIVPFAIGCIMVRLFFATSFEIYSASQFYLSLVTGLDVTRNISTAESPDTLAVILLSITLLENN